ARLHVTAAVVVAVGTLTQCIVHPRDIFREAIARNAASIILVHVHPSGDPSPSFEDDRLTERVGLAAEIVGIPPVDHIVVGDDTHYSYAESGLIGRARIRHG